MRLIFRLAARKLVARQHMAVVTLKENQAMKRQSRLICASIAFVIGAAAYSPAMALTTKECSVKYKAAKKAGTLNGMKWKEFRKAECGVAAAPAAAAAAPAASPAHAAKTERTPAMRTTMPSSAVFPTAISPKYAKDSRGKARMKTCVDQYRANKAHNANGGLKWIQKGGGYWSECDKRLKG